MPNSSARTITCSAARMSHRSGRSKPLAQEGVRTAILGGWALSGIFNVWSGAPFYVTASGEFPEALYNFEKAIRHRPGFAPYLYDYALTLARASQIDRAQEQARAAVHADPNLSEARVLLGSLFARKQQFSEAAGEYQQALRLRPELARVRLDLASVLAAQGDMPAAVQQLREVAKGNDAEAARLATEALQRLGER